MNLRNFLVIKSIVSLCFGLALTLVPTALLSLYAVPLDANGAFMARFFGACLIGIGLVCWMCKNEELNTLQALALALCIGDTVGFVVALQGHLAGLTNAFGWSVVIIWLFLAAGFGYFRFINRNMSSMSGQKIRGVKG